MAVVQYAAEGGAAVINPLVEGFQQFYASLPIKGGGVTSLSSPLSSRTTVFLLHVLVCTDW